MRLDDVVLDACFDDPELLATRDAVRDASHPAQERADRATRLVPARRPHPEEQLLAQEVLADAGHHLADELARRATAPDLDAEDRADMLGLAAAAHVAAARQVRGAGTADTVDADPAKASHALIEISDDLALDGLRAVPEPPGCALVRVVAGRGRGVSDDELLHRFEVARRREPLAFAAHLQTLQAVRASRAGRRGRRADDRRLGVGEHDQAQLGETAQAVAPSAVPPRQHLVEGGAHDVVGGGGGVGVPVGRSRPGARHHSTGTPSTSPA